MRRPLSTRPSAPFPPFSPPFLLRIILVARRGPTLATTLFLLMSLPLSVFHGTLLALFPFSGFSVHHCIISLSSLYSSHPLHLLLTHPSHAPPFVTISVLVPFFFSLSQAARRLGVQSRFRGVCETCIYLWGDLRL
ncbi:hypothetical protein V8E53_005921 [Lactarius tabidus]